ncbi:MAG: glycogen/starch synthase [Bacteroidaceae bacterium]|nr:glycogen/starch synthase [Bacteroidaceae bacterium]
MAKAEKILFIVQEMIPYVAETPISEFGRKVPQRTQDCGREIRSFMPKWGGINERRNQLHEVIRLSGMNIILDDTDHPLIIKVASIPSARMQVYFIDNEDYFNRRLMSVDAQGEEYADNAERAIFFARGVLETVKKLKWTPDVIHCQGWMSAVVPFYIKKAYSEEPSFRDCKIVYTPVETTLRAPLPSNIVDFLNFRGATMDLLGDVGKETSIQFLDELAVRYSDGIAFMHDSEPLRALAQQGGKHILEPVAPEDFGKEHAAFYDRVCGLDGLDDED